MVLAYRLGHLCPLSITSESSHALASSAEVLWRGAEAAGVADAMIKAQHQIIETRKELSSK